MDMVAHQSTISLATINGISGQSKDSNNHDTS